MTAFKPVVVDAGQLQNLPTGCTLNVGAYQFPAAIGTDNQVLTVNGSGTELEWRQPVGVITANTVFYLDPTGNDSTNCGSSVYPWLTLNHAFDYLKNYTIARGIVVTIQLNAGHYTMGAEFVLSHPCLPQITITGCSVTTGFTSVVSSSGNAPDRSYVLAVNSTANISANDYAFIPGCAGGTYPQYMAGVHEITDVDDGNTRITVLNKSLSSNAASGNVNTAGVYILNTVLDFSGQDCNGFRVLQQDGPTLTKMALVGVTGNASLVGVQAAYGASINCTSPFGVWGFGVGYQAYAGSTLSANTCGVEASITGFQALFGSTILCAGSGINGTTNYGLLAERNSSVIANGTTFVVGCAGLVSSIWNSYLTVAGTSRLVGAASLYAGLSQYNSVVDLTGITLVNPGANLSPASPYNYSVNTPALGTWMLPP
jgi:hypothetical protein